ncbi:sorbitol dehydrogenase [Agrilus planipennis]|uniref:Sorbitol dehydrogenase n=1 Tax=Agrilus planipennis TaxID=224129 RepID=A0A1W4X416_AGRPL|nr:sorbitol dehydrogenase [Agrilus planipennis]
MVFCATPPVDGNLARYYVHDADFLFKLPSHVSLEEGAILEPLSVGVHACKRGGVQFGSTVFISGAGPIGLVSLLAAKAFGATKVAITDLVESRLEVAKKLGADYTILLKRGESEESLLNRIREALGDLATVSLDCSGVEQSVRIAIQATRSGGTAVLVGLGGKENLSLPLSGTLVREVDIRGVFRYVNDYQTSLDLIATGKINVKPLITHNYTMEDTVKAFETSKTGAGNAIKVLIHANPDWKP